MSETAAADPFAPGAGDPFASGGDPSGETPVQPEPDAEADIPTVNAEGQRIDPPAEPQADTGGTAEVGQPPEPPDAPEQPAEAPEPPAEQPEPPGAPAEPQTTPAPPQEPQEQPQAEAPQEQPEAQPAPAQPATEEQQPEAPAPAADGGKSPLRHYTLLYQTGDKQWGEYDLTSIAADMKEHVGTEDGVTYLRARNADHARRIAWIIFGRPENGVTVNPVAKSSWNPKRLAPAPPQPTRERLSIS